MEGAVNPHTFDVYLAYHEQQMKLLRNLATANHVEFASPEQCWALHEAYHSFKKILEIHISCYNIACLSKDKTNIIRKIMRHSVLDDAGIEKSRFHPALWFNKK